MDGKQIRISLIFVIFIVLLAAQAQTDTKAESEALEIDTQTLEAVIEETETQTEESTTCEYVEKTTAKKTSELQKYFDVDLNEAQQDIVLDVCSEFGIEPELIFAIAYVESRYNPSEIGDNGESLGMLQIQPKWWQHYFDKYCCDNWLEVEDNVIVGCAILSEFYSKYGDTRLVLNTYNTGKPHINNGYADKVLGKMAELKGD